MVNLRLGAAFGALTVALVVFVQLLAMARDTEQAPASSFNKNFNQWISRANSAADDGLFKIGAGKADVTGYRHPFGSRPHLNSILTKCPAPSSR